MRAGVGHNNGPTMEPGFAFRRHCWTRARADLLPKLPIEIIRARVKRAREVGLDYKTYASVRAASGHDVVAFLFSSNALRVVRRGQDMPGARQDKLIGLTDVQRSVAAQPPLDPRHLEGVEGVDHAFCAPVFGDSWSVMRDKITAAIQEQRLPRDGVVVIADTTLEREWAEAGRLAGVLGSERFFENAAGRGV